MAGMDIRLQITYIVCDWVGNTSLKESADLSNAGTLEVGAQTVSPEVGVSPAKPRTRSFGAFEALLLGALCLVGLLLAFYARWHSHLFSLGALLDSVKAVYKDLIPLSWRVHIYSLKEHFLQIFANPYYYLGVTAVLILEWMFPAKKNQRVLSVGFVQDFCYYFIISMFLIYATGPFIHYLDLFYARRLSILTIRSAASWPLTFRIVFALVFNDLLHWTHHYLRHKKPLWHFHAIHHAQREMNLFTDTRSHFVETFFSLTVVFIPLNMFSVTFANSGWVYLIPLLYFRLYHANIRTNFGPLKYILVTPQSHRIHHSIERKHWDKNFGFIFTVWDHIFGTQYKNYDEYPDTGIVDANFPLERNFTSVVKMVFVQWLYPFRQLWQKDF